MREGVTHVTPSLIGWDLAHYGMLHVQGHLKWILGGSRTANSIQEMELLLVRISILALQLLQQPLNKQQPYNPQETISFIKMPGIICKLHLKPCTSFDICLMHQLHLHTGINGISNWSSYQIRLICNTIRTRQIIIYFHIYTQNFIIICEADTLSSNISFQHVNCLFSWT